MFDIGASELLMVVIVAVVVIGPKDMPMAMRTAGRWIGKMRKISGHFRSGIDAMVREAELEEMEKKWREQNEAIMRSTPKLPTAEEMQAPIASAPELSDQSTPSEPETPSTFAAETQPPAADAGDGPAKDTRQAELHLPPPPP
ncbi:Sec-independent protein translocase protein TatB [Novosphingobium mangrovi (ex Huang et al. 2023)]|uniref:Sec-independent protein translocase protein TatB n=1 Tax=Novosphingobium mangrovi (ex Huang et al. 2023) TaxID=2976432 RepID=A0ABT2I080_9SPHN|nr:Sec-independent protein translocase protein TatB [Novosphingobium mangrovi (ex Huang et al. 2023)]MCT2398215.1 Sec-independent protein translocase protein TatB [Novosphingobium mangrovi (ex Huang et al. 2023)]